MSSDWRLRWLGLIFAGYGVLFALILNRYVLDLTGWSSFLLVLFISGLLGAIGHRVGRRRLRDIA